LNYLEFGLSRRIADTANVITFAFVLPDDSQKLKRIDLQFMNHENWIVDGNIGKRDPELQLRQVRLTPTSIREEGGEKMIKY